MKKNLDIIAFLLFLTLIGLSIYGYLQVDNLFSQIEIKDKRIKELVELRKVSEKNLQTKDNIIADNDEVISGQKTQLEAFKNSGQVFYAGFTYEDKTISTEELLTLFNKIHKENEHNKFLVNTIKEKYGLAFNSKDGKLYVAEIDSNSVIQKLEQSNKDRLKTINRQIKELNELYVKESALGLIQKAYNIPYKITGNTISIPDNKIDTLLMIYPIIKNRIKIKGDKLYIKGL